MFKSKKNEKLTYTHGRNRKVPNVWPLVARSYKAWIAIPIGANSHPTVDASPPTSAGKVLSNVKTLDFSNIILTVVSLLDVTQFEDALLGIAIAIATSRDRTQRD
jgi:hypothetical protein